MRLQARRLARGDVLVSPGAAIFSALAAASSFAFFALARLASAAAFLASWLAPSRRLRRRRLSYFLDRLYRYHVLPPASTHAVASSDSPQRLQTRIFLLGSVAAAFAPFLPLAAAVSADFVAVANAAVALRAHQQHVRIVQRQLPSRGFRLAGSSGKASRGASPC